MSSKSLGPRMKRTYVGYLDGFRVTQYQSQELEPEPELEHGRLSV